MRRNARAAFAALALVLASCQGSGLDSGMGGGMSPPVTEPGQMGANGGGIGGMNGGLNGNGMAGPNVGLNGQEQLAPNPGSTLAPNEAQYGISQGPSGMKCAFPTPYNQQYGCTLSFNIPTPGPNGSPGAPTPTPTASPTPTPSASSDDDSSDDGDSPTPSPPPLGTLTILTEPLPKDIPAMTNPDVRFMQITPLVAIRLQSNMDFTLSGGTTVQYTLPASQFAGRVFALQLYNESTLRGKRVDQIIGSYGKWTSPQSQTVQFSFNVPRIAVRRSQVWLLAMYGATLPPGSTPTPSPSPAASASPSASP